jgi:protein-disulfide isomerase
MAEKPKSGWNVYFVLGIVCLVILFALVFYFFFMPAPLVNVNIEGDPMLGNPDANVTIIEFSDFECPVCAEMSYPALKQLMQEYGDRVRLVYKDYPLDTTCNSGMGGQLHPHACIAAEAAQCAFEQDKFWEYQDVLFQNQEALALENLQSYATSIGLDMTRFNDCLTTRRQANTVLADIAEGDRILIQGTPTVIINGQVSIGVPDYEELKKIVEGKLKTS